MLLPNSSLLVSVRAGDLDIHLQHQIRIIVPMTDDRGRGVIQLEGIWLSKAGRLLRIDGSLFDGDLEDEDSLDVKDSRVGETHRSGLNAIFEKEPLAKVAKEILDPNDDDVQSTMTYRKKVLEVITDSPGSLSAKSRGKRRGGADGLLAGVMSWEYLLGEMFGADHVTIGVDGMCLTQDCIGAAGIPSGMGDVFFRRCAWPTLIVSSVCEILLMLLSAKRSSTYSIFRAPVDVSYLYTRCTSRLPHIIRSCQPTLTN